MSEFDIRIGTLLDTSKAEAQLQEFVNKYSSEDAIKLRLDISNEGDLNDLEKSIKTIAKLAKSIENIRLDIDTSDVTKVEGNLGETIKKQAKELEEATQSAKKEIGNTVDKSFDNFGKEIDSVKKKIGTMLDDLQQLKSEPFANIEEINKLQGVLRNLGNTDIGKDGALGLQSINKELDEIKQKYLQIDTAAKNSRLSKSFEDIKVTPLLNQLDAVREVMEFKKIDTSGIDALINRLKSVGTQVKDLKQIKEIFNDVKGDFSNLKKALDLKGIDSSELAIKKLLEYKEELNDAIRFEIDSSKIEDAYADIKRIDEAVDRLRKNSDKSLVGNLIDINELNDIKNMESAIEKFKANASKMNDVFDKLKANFNKLKGEEFADISSMANLELIIKNIDNAMKSLDFDKMTDIGELNKIKEQMETLENAIKSTEKAAKNAKLDFEFNEDLTKVTNQLNGLQSALVKIGGNSSINIKGLKEELESIANLAKVDLDRATSELTRFGSELKSLGKEFGLGNISGDLSQFSKYIEDIQSAMKKLASTKDINVAKNLEDDIKKALSALKQLESGFDEVQKEFAEGIKSESFKNLGKDFQQELNKINAEAEKLQTTLYRVGRDADFSGNIGEKLANDLKEATDRVEKLQSALRNIDVGSGKEAAQSIQNLKQELEQAKQSVTELGKARIELDCEQALSRLQKLKNEIEEFDGVLNGLDGETSIRRIFEDFENGAMSFDRATTALKKFESAMDRVENSSTNVRKSFDMFDSIGRGLEGTFQNIGDAFRRFTLGELLEEGIESAIYGIKEAIMGLDTAMTEFKRVAPEGISFDDAGYKQIANDAREIAISVGQSTEDVIVGMSTALQAGATTMQQATEIARTSAILQNVSDMSAESASQAIASMVNQYYSMGTALDAVQNKVKNAPADYNNLTNAIDMVNYAGNNYAISTEGVTQALQNGGSVLSSYGVTLSDSIALISAANESMQDPSRIGNGLKSLAINFAGIKTNAKEGTIEMNKSAMALKEIAGIDIFTDASKTSVKDMMTLMDEIRGKWDSLTDVQQKGLSEGLAGKTQAAVFQSLMQGWQRVKQFQQEYNEGLMVGSAQDENLAYLDSIQGKWNQLKETMKGLVTSNVSQSFIKGMLEGATDLVKSIDTITTKLGAIKTIGVTAGLASFIKMMSSFSKIDMANGVVGNLTGIAKLMATLGTSFSSGFKADGLIGGLKTLGSGLKALVTGAGAAKLAVVGLQTALTGIGVGIAVAGIVALVKHINNVKNATENAVKSAKEMQNSARDNIANLSQQKASLSEIAKEYDTLSQKTSKTAEEYDKFRELKHEVANLVPDLVMGYDANNDPILKLNGSLTQYCAQLDTAIAKQQALFRQAQAEEADAYLKDNEKKPGEEYDSTYNLTGNKINSKGNWAYGMNAAVDAEDTAQEIVTTMEGYRKNREKLENDMLKNISTAREKFTEKDVAIQAKYINEFMEGNKKLSQQQKDTYAGFMESLGWGSLELDEADDFAAGLEKLAGKTAFTRNEMGSFITKIDDVRKAFNDDGRINKYGKALEEIAIKSKTFDLQSWNEYMAEVNQRYAEGTLNQEQYAYSMGIVAETMASLTNMPESTFTEALIQTGDIEAAFMSAQSGLNNFMSVYNKSVKDLRNNDSVALALSEQYDSLINFGDEFERQIKKGEIDVEWVLNEKESLPGQMQKMIELATKHDNDITEVEQKVIMGVQTEIKEHGKLKDDTIKKIEDLLSDDFVIDKPIEIAGMEFSIEQAKQLRDELRESGITAEQIALDKTGIEEVVAKAKEFQTTIEGIEDIDIKLAIEGQTNILDTKQEVDMMVEAIEQIKDKDAKLNFIAETSQFFDGKSSIDEAIADLPDNLKLKYDIGIEGDQRLTDLKTKVEALPGEIKTYIYAGTYGEPDVDRLTQMVETFGETNATALLEVEGVQEAIQNATSLEECLNIITGKIHNSELTFEVRDEIIKQIETKLKELDGKETTVEVSEEGATETKEAIEEVGTVADEVNNKEVTQEVKEEGATETKEVIEEVGTVADEVNNKEVTVEVKEEGSSKTKEAIEEVDNKGKEYDNSTYTSEADMNTDAANEKTNELINKTNEILNTPVTGIIDMETSDAQSKINELNEETKEVTQPKQGVISLTVEGKEQIALAINDKNQLEKDGQAITNIQLNGGEQLPIAINDKNQLEVAGTALTNIDISGLDQIEVALNEKGQLEVNGQAVTDIVVNGNGEVEKAKETLDGLEEEKSVNVSFNVNNALDSILSRLGLSKQKETIQITVTCVDNASPVLDKINAFVDKTITLTVNCNGGEAVANQVRTISSTQIANKSFSVTANAGAASSAVTTLANMKIPSKTFGITCTDNATSKISALTNRQVPNKTFTVNCNDSASSVVNKISNTKVANKKFNISCTDNASSTINKVQNRKISNKSFSVSCKDSASGVLSSISSKLGGIKSKSVTVTVAYKQVGKPPSSAAAGGGSASTPQVVDTEVPILVNNTANVSALADTQSNIASVRNAMASVQASYTDTINSSYTWVNDSIEHDIDLLQDFNSQLERISNSLNLVSKQAEDAFGNAKANLLQRQVELLEQQKNMLNLESKELKSIQSNLKTMLSNQGFTVDSNGAVTNYASKILQLEKAAESAKKAQDAYTGEDKNRQKQLQNAYDSANEKLTKAKNTLSEYYEVSNKLGSVATEWENIKQAIEDAKNEMTLAIIEQNVFFKELTTQNLENQYDTIADKIELLNAEMDVSGDRKKVSLLEQQYELLDKQQDKLNQVKNSYNEQLKYYKDFLSQKGFSFDADGNADTIQLQNLKKSNAADYDAIYEAYETYTKLLRDTIPDLEKEWYNLQKEQNDTKQSMIELQDEILEFNRIKAFDFIDELSEKQERLENQLDKLDAKLELTYGKNKEQLLREQIGAINSQIQTIEQANDLLKSQKIHLQGTMFDDGFKFNANGDIINLDDLLSLTKTQEEYDRLKEKAETYYDTQKQIEEGETKWLEYQKQVEETKNEIEELKLELKEMVYESNITELSNNLQVLQNELDKLDSMQNLNNKNSFEIYEKQLELVEKQKEETTKLLDYQEERSKELARDLSSYGFTINDDGTIDNVAERLEKLKNALSDDEFSRVEGFLEDYFEIALEEIPDLEKQLIDYQVEYEEIQKSKLEATEKIEKEITSMLEKQLEERIKQIEEERDAQLEALDKQKEAYEKWKASVDYEEDYSEQLLKVQELQNQIDMAKKDDSLSGKKRLEDLMKQLSEEQKTLEDLVEDRMDTLTEEMFDEATEKIQEDADKQIEVLEDTYTEEKIAEMVAGALKEMDKEFIGINENFTNLEEALMDFANSSVEYMGVMGDTLRTELLDNLNVAKETMEQIKDINAQLGNDTYEFTTTLDTSVGSLDTDLANPQKSVTGITLGDLSITIQGNATEGTIEDIKGLFKEYQEKMIHEIMVNVK